MKLLCNIEGNILEYNILSRSKECESFKVTNNDNYLGYGFIIDNPEEGYYHFWYNNKLYKG